MTFATIEYLQKAVPTSLNDVISIVNSVIAYFNNKRFTPQTGGYIQLIALTSSLYPSTNLSVDGTQFLSSATLDDIFSTLSSQV